MAKISTYTTETAPADADYVPIVDASEAASNPSAANKKLLWGGATGIKGLVETFIAASATVMGAVAVSSTVINAMNVAARSYLEALAAHITFLRGIVNTTAGSRWQVISASSYTALPLTERWSGGYSAPPDLFDTTSAWQTTFNYALGDWAKATTSGYLLECVADAGSSGANDLIFVGAVQETDIVDDGITWRPRGCHVIEMLTNMSSTLLPGIPLRYKYGGSTYYGIVGYCTSARLAVIGAPLQSVTGQELTELAYGPMSQKFQVNFAVAGTYGDGVDTDLLLNDMNQSFETNLGEAKLVSVRAFHKTDDTGANQPTFNVRVGGTAVMPNDNYAGWYPVTTGFTRNHYTDVKSTWYGVSTPTSVTIECTAAGSNGDASDLTVETIWVLT